MNPQQLLVSHETSLGGTVLVVDDDDATCQLLGEWVRLLGFDVMTAHGAIEALALMRDRPAQVAFCDIVMPGRDGVWLIDQLRRHFPGTAVVVATGMTRLDPSVTLAPSVTGYIIKPFDFEDVAAAVGGAFAACTSGYRQ
jgi:DNA-binding NtrC family response regulator